MLLGSAIRATVVKRLVLAFDTLVASRKGGFILNIEQLGFSLSKMCAEQEGLEMLDIRGE